MFPEIDITSAMHLCYLSIGITVTVWVAHTLRIHGRVFLAKGCKGDIELVNSLSHLFSVGFYLIHIGFLMLALKLGGRVSETVGAIELLSTKIGLVLLVLGVSHFTHIAVYARIHGKPRPAGNPVYDNVAAAEVVK